MKFSIRLILLGLFFVVTMEPASADQVKPVAPALQRFIESADRCIHLSGEISGEPDKEQERLIRQANRLCEAARRQFQQLDRQARNDVKIQAALEPYREDFSD